MPDELPPDLSRLGDEIVAAVQHTMRARRRRRITLVTRAAACVTAAVGVAAFVPVMLAPAERSARPATLMVSSTPESGIRPGCDHPRTATFAYPRPCRRAGEGDSVPVVPDGQFALVERRR